MTTFHVLTGLNLPQLHIWRDRTADASAQHAYDLDGQGLDADGLWLFSTNLDHQLHEPARALLHLAEKWEQDIHRKDLPRGVNYVFPPDLWFAEGAKRVLTRNPFDAAEDGVRIHLVTGDVVSADRYLDGKVLIWSSDGKRLVEHPTKEASGVVFDVPLADRDRNLFLFKFVDTDGTYESDEANRLWCSQDGGEIWVLPESSSIRYHRPMERSLVVYLKRFDEPTMPVMRIWHKSLVRESDVTGTREADGWVRFEFPLYTEFTYEFLFHNPERATSPWENKEANRNVYLASDGSAWTIDGDGKHRLLGNNGVWTLEGDHELFGEEPAAAKLVTLECCAQDPLSGLGGPLVLDVWINRARSLLHRDLEPDAAGRWTFSTFPNVVTSFVFRSADAKEPIERHCLKVGQDEGSPAQRFVVIGRADLLVRRTVSDLFSPPFTIERPGTWIADGFVRFAVHCPTAACVEVIGEWNGWEDRPLTMRSTRDGTYWWGQVPVDDIIAAVGRPSVHGTLYKFRLNQTMLVQDPAADWVENSSPDRASMLVDHTAYAWRNNTWRRPGWEYLTVYQLHPARFGRRGGTYGLDGITRELADPNGYLRRVSATALLLMPTCEYALNMGWGYNPAFFYSVESSYGGPDALKRLVDECHERGFAVLLDVVFNHAGTSDNVLWKVARNSFFDGDTEWGAMINFDHPQVIHFFEQNIVHFMRNYRIDGFRFDFTRVIRFGDQWVTYVKQPGSGGGWEFMRRLQSAARAVDGGCIFMAENLPNDWDLTRAGGVMDTQWNDNFHDTMVEAARGRNVMPPLADAIKITNMDGARWFESTNYPESHDEVGNEDHRISRVGEIGQGYRRNKVAAAATLVSRGIPMWFMGAESGEWRQFSKDGDAALDLDFYERDESAIRIRNWWNKLAELRRGNPRIQGPAPVRVWFAQGRMLALSRGEGDDLFVVLNFGDWSGWRPLAELNLPDGDYKELLNSSWGDYRIAAEGEDEQSNGGWDAHLNRGSWLNIPDYAVVVLEKR